MERKLAAVFSADVKGYSRLMGEDEEATIRTLTAYRELMTSCIQQHRGRVVDSPGDNLLAEFASVVDAVQGAVEIQKELKARNTELPTNRQMHYRIGINVGDVVVEGERIYGDGVNIAARLESLAEGGGICISEAVHMQIKNKLSLGYSYQGEQQVKNIVDPVRIYKVQLEAQMAAPSVIQEPPVELPLPDKPSIAVLPFTNMSADPEQEYFSDGITEDLITDLSKISGLFVIARNSTFTYKGQTVDVGEVGRKLGVRHVLEGSVRKVGNRVRINVQLIDAPSGGHVWAERYDRELEDIFALQDEVTQKIVRALEVKLTAQEQGRVGLIPTHNLEAYDYFLRGTGYLWRITKETNIQARQLFEKAIELDPEYAAAYAFLGFAQWMEWVFAWNQDPQVVERAFALAQRAVTLDDSLPEAHGILGFFYAYKKQLVQAITEGERAIALNPNFADGYVWLGFSMSFVGKPEEAIELVQKGMRLNPSTPFLYLACLGHAYYLLRRYEEAIAAQKQALALNPHNAADHMFLALSYIELGRKKEARAEIIESLRLSPFTSPRRLRQRLPYTDQAVVERILDSARKALATLGVKDYVSLLITRLSRYFHLRRKQDTSLQ